MKHIFTKEIKKSLKYSCKERVVENSVNIICNDGIVSCNHLVLALASKKWQAILLTTNDDTPFILAPDFTLKFMKSYLLSCISNFRINEKNKGEQDDEFQSYCNDRTEDDLEPFQTNRQETCSRRTGLEKKEDVTGSGDGLENYKSIGLVSSIVREIVEEVADGCEKDYITYKHKYKKKLEHIKDDEVDNYDARYFFDYGKRNYSLIRVPDEMVRAENFTRIVENILDKIKSPLIETFEVTEKFACNICLKKFSRVSNCKAHMRTMHSGVKKYQCDKCKTQFQTECGLRSHLKESHENESKDPFICATCGAVFLHERSLLRHCKAKEHTFPHKRKPTSKKVEDRSRVTQCNICHRMIAGHRLESHIKKNHTDKAREFNCSECNYKTDRKDTLNRHLTEVHNIYSSNLSAIEETFKEGISTYHCPECKEILRSISEVKNHVVGKICLLSCNICKKRFSRKHNLKQHMKRFHQESNA